MLAILYNCTYIIPETVYVLFDFESLSASYALRLIFPKYKNIKIDHWYDPYPPGNKLSQNGDD